MPMPIHKLPPLLISQIAAGEVIERPASIVKELVENSLDAGASRVDIVVEDGGRQLVRVSDDGQGVAQEELALAVGPHATSKLSTSEDLASIGTLGFRGEALASIASVSRLRMTSRATIGGKAAESAWVIEAAGGDGIAPPAPAAQAAGTIVEVRDLFFNTPARRKFMRAASTEFGHINEALTRIAMVNPDVAFTLAHGGRKVVDVPPQTPRLRCVELLGSELNEVLLEFEQIEMQPPADAGLPASVWGMAGMPSIARASAKFQYISVNGRPMKDRGVSHAIREAYRGLLPPDRYPVAVVAVQIVPAAVDVNVHPTKAEVRFRQPSRIHGLVLHALRQRLLGSDLTPSATVGLGSAALSNVSEHASGPAGDGAGLSASEFVDYFRQMAPTQKGFVYEQVKAAMGPGDAEAGNSQETLSDAWAEAGQNTGDQQLPAVLAEQGILQVHKSYLVTQDDHGLLIIDQHALHERVLFEQLRDRMLSGSMESQRLLMPAVVKASPKRQQILDQFKPLLDQLGVEVEQIGPESAAVQSFPTLLFARGVDPGQFVDELLDRVEAGQISISDTAAKEAALHEVLDMMACKAAVKAGDRLTSDELASLLQQREQIERSSSCPHGRPTTIRMSLGDLAKHFKRG